MSDRTHPLRRRLTVLALTAGLIGCLAGASSAATTSGDPVTGVKSIGGGALYNGKHVVFVVKDLGGGAYWNATTHSLYALATASDLANSEAATVVDDGRGTLLLLNGEVLVPLEQAVLGG